MTRHDIVLHRLLTSSLPELLRRAVWLLTVGADGCALRLFDIWRTQRGYAQIEARASLQAVGCHPDPDVVDKVRTMLEAAFMVAMVHPPRERTYREWRAMLRL